MTDSWLIGTMLRRLAEEEGDLAFPRAVELVAIGFPDERAAQAVAAKVAHMGFMATVGESPPLSQEDWDDWLREAGFPPGVDLGQ